MTCPNPFCNGKGDIDVSVKADGSAWAYGTCGVGPHPPKQSSETDAKSQGRESDG